MHPQRCSGECVCSIVLPDCSATCTTLVTGEGVPTWDADAGETLVMTWNAIPGIIPRSSAMCLCSVRRTTCPNSITERTFVMFVSHSVGTPLVISADRLQYQPMQRVNGPTGAAGQVLAWGSGTARRLLALNTLPYPTLMFTFHFLRAILSPYYPFAREYYRPIPNS